MKKGDNSRGLVEALLVRPPGLQGASGNLKRFGRFAELYTIFNAAQAKITA